MTVNDGGTASEGGFLRCFGRQLRLLRERAGLTRAELGARLGYSEGLVASVELGRRIPKPEFIQHADEVLDAGGLLAAMESEVARARYPEFFRDAAKLEAEAVELHVYANQAVPGLLQTEEYARAVFGARRPLLDEEVIAERVAARLARQSIFERKPLPTISFVIEEVVLRRPIGGPTVWRGQLEELLLRGSQRNVEIQMMPTEVTEHAALAGPFTLIETLHARRIAYVEVQKESRLLQERCAVREYEEQYGILRAQALTPRESLSLVEKLLGDR
ncbi:helix-turn-helix domain-containing protein [Streptomyces sp. NBC_00006]|uniref:helix-turn-helix domain-containing protein n=1 Tax=Streptomyces sp. NBC_00006 TaxID=2975619 RepID=UPI002253CC6F|nr:helix-turn-helix transcriptional regulator [Streptomyces sp. NBC_00006]MCX5529777.1 helix-turn-helix domain-containing protein [Streptomyces sp. NBC_00006]